MLSKYSLGIGVFVVSSLYCPNAGFTQSLFGPTLVNEVQKNIEKRRDLRGYDLTIDSHRYDITISGRVSSHAVRREILSIAQATERVDDVIDKMTVVFSDESRQKVVTPIPSSPQFSDEDLRAKVLTAIREDLDDEGRQIQVSVNEGVVTLSGDIASFRAVDSALANALMVPGVKELKNQITIQEKSYGQVWESTQRADEKLGR